LSEGIDFEELDISPKFTVVCDPIRMSFTQEIFTYMYRVNYLNLQYEDLMEPLFQLGEWNDPDTQKWI
jgi:hypothetical protein